MKSVKHLLLLGITLMFGITVSAQHYPELELGASAPMTDVKMTDISGKSLSLSDISEKNGLLVIFSCNTCPWVVMWENRYNDVAEWAKKNKVGFVLVNSNYNKREGDDSLDNMKKHAKEKGYNNIYYVVDKESKLANAMGGKTTPHVFLFNNEMELVYKGAIDDNPKDKDAVSAYYLKDALMALSSGETIAVNSTAPKGCSIKRKLD